MVNDLHNDFLFYQRVNTVLVSGFTMILLQPSFHLT